ncbi:hypothetical protein V8919_21000, partial [Ralstonia mannitolilytica]|uniref:hypothetical protein n=4 Tax=Ralstonia mannitolilytica TaxID=105219 RepID=UPI003B8424AF
SMNEKSSAPNVGSIVASTFRAGALRWTGRTGACPPALALMLDKMLVAHDRDAHWIVRDSSAVFLCCRRCRRPAAPLPLEFLSCGPMPYPPPLRNENAFRGRPCWDFIKIA